MKDGRTPWQAMKDRRCIMLRFKNGSEVAPCSMELKQETIDCVIASRYQPGTYTRVFGMDWTEMHQVRRLQQELAPQPVWFPLLERPYCKCFDSMTATFAHYLTECQHCLFFHHQWKELRELLQGLPLTESRLISNPDDHDTFGRLNWLEKPILCNANGK